MARTQVFLLSLVALLAGSLLCLVSRELHTGPAAGPTIVASVSTPVAPPVQSQQAPPRPEPPAATALPSEAQAPSVEPAPAKPSRRPSTELRELSRGLSDDLQSHKLPLVDAHVYGSLDGQPSLVRLSGYVHTQKGKDDAELRSRDFLGNPPRLHIRNLVVVDASVVVPNAPGPGPAPDAPSTPESGSPSGPGATTAPANPCSSLCLKDCAYCKNTCLNSTPKFFGLPPPWAVANAKQCVDDCENKRDHCVADCAQSGGPEQPPGGANAPSEGPAQPPG